MQCTAALQASSAVQPFAQRSGAVRAQRGSLQVRSAAATGFWDTPTASSTNGMDSMIIPSRGNTWIEKPEAVKDFATLQAMLDEVQQNISLRQDTISLLTGEVQRLSGQMGNLQGSGMPSSNGASPSASAPSSLQLGAGSPADKAASMAANLLAQRADMAGAPSAAASVLYKSGLFSADKSTQANLGVYGLAIASIVVFGGVVAPVLEDKMGLGGAAYYDFITSSGLPNTMAEVDPIVASHAGGAAGVLTAQLAAQAAEARRRGRARQ